MEKQVVKEDFLMILEMMLHYDGNTDIDVVVDAIFWFYCWRMLLMMKVLR